jgi:hypothetical protein
VRSRKADVHRITPDCDARRAEPARSGNLHRDVRRDRRVKLVVVQSAPMRGRLLVALAAPLLLLAGCSGSTSPADQISDTSARANAHVDNCDHPDTCTFHFVYGKHGGTLNHATPVQGPWPGVPAQSNIDVHDVMRGLDPGTQYDYQFCGKGDPTDNN